MPVLDIGEAPGADWDASTCTPWAEVGDVCAPCNDYEFDVDDLDDWLQMATDFLYDVTRRRWPGLCSAVVRPCARELTDCACNAWHAGQCGCRRVSQVDLQPHGRVQAIDSVTIDGATLDPARYRLDERRWLVYLPESPSSHPRGWPLHQRLDLPLTADQTWSIAYTYGTAPPIGGVKAAAALGCELALSCHSDPTVASRCRLPKAVTNVSRQGVTIAKANPSALFPGGVTGIQVVDLWVAGVNIGSTRRPATVFRPGQLATYRGVAPT